MKRFSLSSASGPAGQRASGPAGQRASGLNSLFVALMVSALSMVSLEQEAQAQLFIDVYQSADDNNNTLWVFSGSSTARQNWHVREGVAANDDFHRRDTWEVVENSGGLYITNAPSNTRLSLTSITSQNAQTSLDRWYVANVLTNISGGDATPTLSLQTGGNTARTRSITHLFMNDDTGTGSGDRDELGIRVGSGSTFTYQNNDASAWSGAGILAKPFSDFYTGATDGVFTFNNWGAQTYSGPLFAAGSDGAVQIRFHRGTVVPEPQEYALVFGLFALGFVLVRRHFQQKKQRRQQQAQAATTS